MNNKHNTNGRQVLHDLDRMQAQIASGHPRADHIRADMVALATEAVTNGCAGWLFLLDLRYLYHMDILPLADALGLSPQNVRDVVG